MAGIRSAGSLVALALSATLLAGCGGQSSRPPESLESFTAEEIYKRGEYELENSRKPQDAVHYLSLIHI